MATAIEHMDKAAFEMRLARTGFDLKNPSAIALIRYAEKSGIDSSLSDEQLEVLTLAFREGYQLGVAVGQAQDA